MSAVRLGVADRRAVALAAAPVPALPGTTTDGTDRIDRTDRSTDRSTDRTGTPVTGAPEVTDLETIVRLRLARTVSRSTDMYASHLINHELAHHRWQELSREARQARLVRVVRAQRRARRAEQRADRAVRSARLASQAALRAAENLV